MRHWPIGRVGTIENLGPRGTARRRSAENDGSRYERPPGACLASELRNGSDKIGRDFAIKVRKGKRGPSRHQRGRFMLEENEFQDLIGRIRAGDEAAAAELVRTYEPAIRRAARVRLADSRLRRVFDSMDICQSVLASFFVRAAMGQYDLERPEQLLGLLVDMSRKKLVDRAREQAAARRDYRRTPAGVQDVGEVAAADPSPSQQAAAHELLREFRNRL